jgi:uncharacterized protein YjbI with pentapeptide repeats
LIGEPAVAKKNASLFTNLGTRQVGPAGAIGPNVRELAQLAHAADMLACTASVGKGRFSPFTGGSERDGVRIAASGGQAVEASYWHETLEDIDYSEVPVPSFEQGMLDLANRCLRGELDLDAITVRAKGCSLRAGLLRHLVIRAWCEAFGVEVPATEALAEKDREQKTGLRQIHAELLENLRGGAAGVKKWNARTQKVRARVGHFRGLDLSGQTLAKINLVGLDFQQTIFDRADLRQARLKGSDMRQSSFKEALLDGADLEWAKFNHANFTGARMVGCRLWTVKNLSAATFDGADLSKAKLVSCNLHGLSFAGANLSDAEVSYCHLQGADLSTANLAGCKFKQVFFDEQTRFPPGFILSKAWIWKGKGPDPRLLSALAAPRAAGTLTLTELLQRLAQSNIGERLEKALAMLKAERFALFAEAEAESVLGVVKSQTNPDLAYSCRLNSSGVFACCTQNLNPCGGLRGRLCKHLLVLIVGLCKAGKLDPATVAAWVDASRAHKPALDKEAMTAVFLRYKEAEAGEIDWRPTETIPEDYYAM